MDLYLELLTICWLFGFFLACSPSSWSNSSQHRTDLAWKRCVFKCTWIDQWLILQQVKIQLKFNHLWCLVWLMPDKILWHVKIDVILLSKIKIDWWCCNVSAYLMFFFVYWERCVVMFVDKLGSCKVIFLVINHQCIWTLEVCKVLTFIECVIKVLVLMVME